MSSATRTILIAGGGMAGLTLALALKLGLGEAIAVTVCDPAVGKELVKEDAPDDGRVSAIAPGSRRMLEALGAWDAQLLSAAPINRMVITDSRLDDPVRPTLLTFGPGADEPCEEGHPLAHMVANADLTRLLRQRAQAVGVGLEATGITRWSPGGFEDMAGNARTADGRVLRASLLIAADGVRSRLRELAGIGWINWSSGQSGLVATIAHERPHDGCAYEHFLASGPFAILPLAGQRSSIVWSEKQENVEALLSLDSDDQLAEIERRFGLELGALRLETPVRAYPLGFGIARSFVAERFALVGDAAHLVHPIAGQGLNIGLRDVAALAEAVIEQVRLGLAPGDAAALASYERGRRGNALAMGMAMDGLNRLFSNDVLPVRLARDLGLGVVERLPGLKRFFSREADGGQGDGPALLRGEMP